ncbi:UNKNOWN [Stylonychia lemnae]|uniref:Pectin lyase fold/virulence factor n=1 Tax=Stylonychia lemnae TaxID=5949 RepID=A0A077ZNM9_STYLE|nr:UNKNOWN [Stylonychia lemnae]|eukprot:CDW71577.1 UNKNOWN [Stylonychia lemnae]
MGMADWFGITIDCLQKPFDNKYVTLEYLRTIPVITNLFQPTRKTPIFIQNANLVSSQANQIRNCYQSAQGGAYYLENTTFYDSQNSTYSYNSAQQGGVIYCKYCKMNIQTASFQNNFANSGGSIFAEQISQINLFNISVRNSSAYLDGGFVHFYSNDSAINKNSSEIDSKDSLGLSFQHTLYPYLIVNDGMFNFTQALRSGGCYYINANYSEIYIENVKSQFHSYVMPTSASYGGLIHVTQADKLQISNSNFMLFNSTNGSFAAIRSRGIIVYISNSNFDQNVKKFDRISISSTFNYARTFGALLIENGKLLSLNSNNFSNCYFPFSGGAISLINTSLVENNTIYRSNYAVQGGSFYSSQQQESTINSIQIQETQAAYDGSGYIVEIQSGNIYISNLSVINASSYFYGFFVFQEYPSSYGTKPPSSNLTVSLQNITIYNTSSQYGSLGNLTIQNCTLGQYAISTPTLGPITSLSIINSTFKNIFQGGCLFTYRINDVQLENINVNDVEGIKESFIQDQGSQITMKNIFLSNIKQLGEGAIKLLIGTVPRNISITNLFAKNISSIAKGSIIYLNTRISSNGNVGLISSENQNTSITIQDTLIQCSDKQSVASNYSGNQNGLIYFTNSPGYLKTQNLEVRYFQGGLIFLERSRQDDNQLASLIFSNSFQILRNQASRGGLIFSDNSNLVLNMINISAQNTSSSLEGGILYTFNLKSLIINNSKFEGFNSPDGGFITSTSTDITMEITNTIFLCNNGNTYQSLRNDLSSQSILTRAKGYLSISNAKNITSINNKFIQCGISSSAGVINLVKSNFTDFNSVFQDNAGLYGGAINIQQSNATFIQSKFLNNQAMTGGAIYVASESSLSLIKCLIKQNYAQITSGAIYLSTSSILQIDQTEFYENEATENSAIEILRSRASANVTIKNSIFEDNKSQRNLISIMYSTIWIENTQFHNNQASQRSKNILSGFSKITISGCDFYQNYKDPNLIQIKNEQTTGTFIFLIFDVSIDIVKTRFYGGVSSNGGSIYISGNSYINIQESRFMNNYASNGGAIYASGFESIYIGNDTEFTNNQAIEMGEDLYISNSENVVTLNNVKISKKYSQNSIYIEQAYLLADSLSIQADEPAINLKNGAGINCNQCSGVKLSKSLMNNLRGIEGGAIYIYESDINKESSDKEKSGKFIIENSVFKFCSAYKGGAIVFENPQSVQIISTKFSMNYALTGYSYTLKNQGSGGAICFTCSSSSGNCRLDLTGQNIFEQNQAEVQGGAICWDQIEPNYQEIQIKFEKNHANQYGDNIASFPQRITIVSQEIYQYQMIKLGLKSYRDFDSRQIYTSENTEQITNADVKSLRSGGEIPKIYIALVDQYGQIVGSDFESKVRVQISTVNLNDQDLKYPPVLEGTTDFQSTGGIAVIQNAQFTGTPGRNYSLSFQTDAIDISKQSVISYLAKSNKIDTKLELNIGLRECEIGEQLTVSGKCQECQNGYSLVKMTEPGFCQACPSDKAICRGGSNIGPLPGFWRMSNTSSTFVECLFDQACLGMVEPLNNSLGECAQGYQGILCSKCTFGYSRDGDFKCIECPEKFLNILRLSAIILVILVVVIFVIRTTLSGAMDKSNVVSIFMKILLNHFQLIMVTASMDFHWSQQILDFFSQTKKVATFSTQIFSVDCFLDDRTSSSSNTEQIQKGIRIFFQKMILVALLPFLLAIGCYCSWNFIGYVKKSVTNKRSKIMSSLVIVLFLAHPSIIQYMFYAFKCKTIEGQERLLEDLWVICWESQHEFWSYLVAFPSILVWGLGIPFFAFSILIKHRKRLEHQITKDKYGFLYRGFKKEFYYWEIVIMYRKIIIIFIAVFISNFGIISQALMMFFIQIWQDFILEYQLALQFLAIQLSKKTVLNQHIKRP